MGRQRQWDGGGQRERVREGVREGKRIQKEEKRQQQQKVKSMKSPVGSCGHLVRNQVAVSKNTIPSLEPHSFSRNGKFLLEELLQNLKNIYS